MFCSGRAWLPAAACFYIIHSAVPLLAEEPARASWVTNPHHFVELAQFVQIPAIRRELELTDAQVSELQVLDKEAKHRFEDFKSQIFRSESAEERTAAFRPYQTDRDFMRLRVDAVLSPAQLIRLKQLAIQYTTRHPGDGFGLLDERLLGKVVPLNEDQAAAVRRKSAVYEKQLRARETELMTELETLRNNLRTELMKELEPEQQAKLRDLWGGLIPIVP